MSIGALRRLETEIGELVESRPGTDLEQYREYRDDPCRFAEDVLDAGLWQRQRDILESVRDYPMVRVQSCNSLGKDYAAAAVAWWWIAARGGFVLITGPSDRQLRNVCMKEIARFYRRAPDLPGELFSYAVKIPGSDTAGLLAFVSTEADRTTGFHAPETLTIITESQGVDDWALEAMLANLAGENDRLLAVGNPISPVGWFFEASKNDKWHSLSVSAFEHPNLVKQRTVIPGAVTQAQVDRIRDMYGETSNVYLSRVLGVYPTSAVEGLFDRVWLERAADLFESGEFAVEAAKAEPIIACDIARFGRDASVAAVRKGPVITRIEKWSKCSLTDTARRIMEIAAAEGITPKWYRDENHFIRPSGRIIVDAHGLGSGVVDTLRDAGYTVLEHLGMRRREGRFLNDRAECHFHLRDLLEQGKCAIEWNEELVQSLLAIEWGQNPSGKVQLAAKEAVRSALGGASPDVADACVMAFSPVDVPKRGMRRFRFRI